MEEERERMVSVRLPPIVQEPIPEPAPTMTFEDYFVPGPNGKIEINLGEMRFFNAAKMKLVLAELHRTNVTLFMGMPLNWLEKFAIGVLAAHAEAHGWTPPEKVDPEGGD